MIAHCLIQDGPAFPYLEPAIYWYIAIGDLNEAVGRSSPIDVVDEDLLVLLRSINNNMNNKGKYVPKKALVDVFKSPSCSQPKITLNNLTTSKL